MLLLCRYVFHALVHARDVTCCCKVFVSEQKHKHQRTTDVQRDAEEQRMQAEQRKQRKQRMHVETICGALPSELMIDGTNPCATPGTAEHTMPQFN